MMEADAYETPARVRSFTTGVLRDSCGWEDDFGASFDSWSDEFSHDVFGHDDHFENLGSGSFDANGGDHENAFGCGGAYEASGAPEAYGTEDASGCAHDDFHESSAFDDGCHAGMDVHGFFGRHDHATSSFMSSSGASCWTRPEIDDVIDNDHQSYWAASGAEGKFTHPDAFDGALFTGGESFWSRLSGGAAEFLRSLGIRVDD